VLPTSDQNGEECFVLEVNRRFCRTKFGNWISAERNLVIAVLTLFRILEAPADGVSILDPRHLPINKLPPPVHIERIIADDKNYDVTNGMHLPARVHDLAIDYTALSLVVPERCGFGSSSKARTKTGESWSTFAMWSTRIFPLSITGFASLPRTTAACGTSKALRWSL
jgi:hypothetical protein